MLELEAALLAANGYFHLYRDTSYLERAREAVRRRLLQVATPKGQSLIAGDRGIKTDS